MATNTKFFVIFFVIFIQSSLASINFFLSENEVYKLFGIEAQLYYIRDGDVSSNAEKFKAHVGPLNNKLTYYWHKTSSEFPVLYDITVAPLQTSGNAACFGDSNSCDIVNEPILSIEKSGNLPDIPENFTVTLDCSRQYDGNATLAMKFVFTIGEDARKVELNIERLKKCKKDHSLYTKPVNPSTTETSRKVPLPGTNHPVSSKSTAAFYISISVVSAVIVMIVVAVAVWHLRVSKKQSAVRTDNSHSMQGNSQHYVQFLRPDLPNNAQKPQSHSGVMQFTPFINDLGADITEIQNKLSDIAIPRSQVDLGDLLHKGQFARIYKGMLKDGTPMLIKTVSDAATEEQRRLLLLESSLLKGMHHKYLLSIKHVTIGPAPAPPLVLFPFTHGGYLKHYLQRVRMDSPGMMYSAVNRNFENASTQDLVEMAIQIACGMTHLSKRGLVHKDLATRNCIHAISEIRNLPQTIKCKRNILAFVSDDVGTVYKNRIDADLRIKITDNALSRDAFPGDYCCLCDNENRPVRWLALESLIHKVYSSASDVWSFGVLLWELQSLADQPYSDIDDFEMETYLSEGYRLSQPQNCPDNLYSIMAGCWHYSPDQRPSFTQLLQLLNEFNAELGDYV